jgi:PAS domain S-box-containing protein
VFLLDVATSSEFVLISVLAVPPFVTAVGAGRTETLVVAMYSIVLAVVAGSIDELFGTFEYVLKVGVVGAAALFAVRVATVRSRAELGAALDFAVAHALATTSMLAEATPKLLDEIGALLGHRAGAIWELAPSEDKLICVEIRHAGNGALQRFAELSRQLEFPMGIGFPGRVWRTGEPTWLENLRLDSSFARGQAATAAGLSGAIAFPITTARGVRGVVEFYTDTAREPDGELFPILRRLGRQIGQHFERRGVEEAIRHSEALRGAVLESALDCVITMNHEGLIVEFNPAAERTFGYKRAEAVGKPLADLIIPPSLRRQHREGLARFQATGEAGVVGKRLELSGMRSDGSVFPVELSITQIIGHEPPMFAGYLRDVTIRKQAEEGMQRLATIVEHSNDAIIAVKPGGEIIAWNPSAERLYGYSPDEAIGRNIAMTVPADRQDEVRELLRKADAGEAVENFETVRMRKDGTPIDISITLSPLKDPDGKLIGTAGIARDITVQKQAERERLRLLENERAARRRAEELERRATFIAEAVPVLGSSLEFEVVVGNFVKLAVPNLADWCAIHTAEPDGTIKLLAVGHSDPAKEELAWELDRRYPTNLDQPEGVPAVLRTGRPQLVAEITEELLEASANDTRYREIVRELGLKSGMIVPLRAREQTFGTITFVSAESNRRYDEDDLEFVMELAKRASLSIDNARLHGDLEARGAELEFLASASAALDRSLDLDRTLQSVADLAVPYLADGCMVDLLDDTGVIRRVASASSDPSIRAILKRLQSHELDLEGSHPIATAMRTGELQVVEEITDELRKSWARDDAYLEDVRAWPGRAAVVAPMRARGRMLGAIALASFGERRFTPQVVATIEELARRAAVAVDNARLYGERSYIASRLQQSLLPPHLPDVPGLEIAARFRPAGEAYDVGGDFYDIFETGLGSWAIALGDVCGKGPDAAALTALARHTLRATAIRAKLRPEHILTVLNDVLIAEAPSQQFLTVTYADLRIADSGTEATVASAGHPLPLLLRGDGRVEHVGDSGTLLGVVPDPELSATELELSPGDTLVFYTDGVTEARTREGLFGHEGLRSTVSACAGCDAAEVAERIENTLLDVQVERPRDDIAIVVVQIPGNGVVSSRREPALATLDD